MTHGLSKKMNALVIGSSGTIGAAFVEALNQDPHCAAVVEMNRTLCPSFDLCDERGIEEALSDGKFSGPFDLIVDATGALTLDGVGPEKSLKSLEGDTMSQAMWVNCIGPALLLKLLMPRLSSERSIYAKLSARVGSITDNKLGGWYSYRASKAAFNMVLQTAAIEHHRRNKKAIFVALQPGTVASALSKPFVQSSDAMSAKDSVSQMLKAMERLQPKSGAHFIDFKGQDILW